VFNMSKRTCYGEEILFDPATTDDTLINGLDPRGARVNRLVTRGFRAGLPTQKSAITTAAREYNGSY
jgi:hypothetical protein